MAATFGEAAASKEARAQSMPPPGTNIGADSATSSSSSARSKPAVPSLNNSPYTFGSASAVPQSTPERALSPHTEGPPPPASMEQPDSSFPPDVEPTLHRPSSELNDPVSPRRGTPVQSQPWTQSFQGTSFAPPARQSHNRKPSNTSGDSDGVLSDDASPKRSSSSGAPLASAPAAPTTPLGIPLHYNLGRRTSVSAESLDPSQAAPMTKIVIPKTASQRARIEGSIKGNLLFRNLDEEQHNDVLNAMKEVRVPENTEVIVQGAVGDFFYVVESGQFEVWVKPSASHHYDPTSRRTLLEQPPAKMVARIEAGGSFGELALMYNAPRAATVVSTSPSSTLWALDRVTFRSILMEHTSRKRKMYEHFLSEVNILVSLETHERAKIADALEEKIYEEGEAVVIEGEVGKNFYIIESGAAQVLKRGSDGHDEEVSTLGRGDYFGGMLHLSLLSTSSHKTDSCSQNWP